MKFHYIAASLNGQIKEGNSEAGNASELIQSLAAQGLRPVSVKPLKGAEAFAFSKKLFGQKITIVDKIFLTKYLSIMLRVGADLFSAINILIADFEKPSLRAFLMEIRDSLERGQPFYATFAHYPQHFSSVFINLVRAGEASGDLDTVFENLSVSLDKEKELHSKVRGALTYPVLLLVLSAAIMIFLTTFALPKLSNIFIGGGFEPPLFSRIVFTAGTFFNTYIWFFLIALFGIVGGLWFFGRTPAGKRVFSHIFIRMPVISKISFQLAIQRFATTLSQLMKAGVPIIESLNITATTVGHPILKESLLRIANDGVAKGLSLGEAFRRESAFPAVVINLVAISEKAGHLRDILESLGKFYEAEIDASIKSAVTFIEPILLLFIGGMIGLIALSIIVPIYQLVGQL